jgi:predicted nucleic acid-binding protein
VSILVETSILVRLANGADQLHTVAEAAIAELHRQGESLRLTPQVLVEFRNVATRPINVNGLGMVPADAERLAAGYETLFPILPETADIFPAWKSLVAQAGVIGKRVHDARLAAVCHVNGVRRILTFNESHFSSLAGYSPGFSVVNPEDVQPAPST